MGGRPPYTPCAPPVHHAYTENAGFGGGAR